MEKLEWLDDPEVCALLPVAGYSLLRHLIQDGMILRSPRGRWWPHEGREGLNGSGGGEQAC